MRTLAFLPVVQRELRAAARRKSTVRIRWWTALIAMGFCFLWVALAEVARTRGGLGNPLFGLLTGYAFGLCLLAGVFLTADSLSEERREGTLGLLFLTDLKGYDVVLGKFVATSLNALYGLLALLPITALPFLLGGVTGGEFWRTALALLNALFFSLAAGLCISAFMRESQRAMGNTLGLLLLLAAALPALTQIASRAGVAAAWTRLAWVSPFYPFLFAAGGRGRFWLGLLASQLLGWALLGLASFALPRVWQEKASRVKGPPPLRPAPAPNRAHSPKQARQRGELLSRNPVMWLMTIDLPLPWRAWVVALAGGLIALPVTLLASHDGQFNFLTYSVARPFGFLLKVLFALQACRFFAEARRNGSLELLLCTPLTSAEIVRGQTLALWRNFLWPLAVFLALLFGPAAIGIASKLAHWDFQLALEAGAASFLSLLFLAQMLADLFALCWFGMGLALTLKKPNLAPGLTILCVLLLPAPLSFCYVDLLVDVFFIAWGVSKCQQDLRRLLAQQYQPIYPGPVLAPPTPTGVPPVLAR